MFQMVDVTGQKYMTYQKGYKLFVWHGGAYIDVCIESTTGNFTSNGKHYVYGEECIDIWDYVKGEPRIPFNKEAFLSEIEEWLSAA